MRYGYAPGCSGPYAGDSAPGIDFAVANALGMTFEEVEEPGGSPTGALDLNGIPAYARVGRLIALAARRLAARGDATLPPAVVTPCGECYRSLSRARRSLVEHRDLREQVAEGLASEGLALEPASVRIRHLLCVLLEDAGKEAIRARVRRPLTGLRVVAYYGCLPPRDPRAGGADEGETESSPLEEVLAALGAEVLDFPLRSHCCAGRTADASEETATSLQQRILRCATDRGADVIAVVCPRCRRNLEVGQEPVNRRFGTRFSLPVRDLTDLVAEAFGIERPAPATSACAPGPLGGAPSRA